MRIASSDSLRACGRLIGMTLAMSIPVCAQTASTPPTQDDLNTKIEALTTSLDQTRAELSESRQEIRQLRSMLEQVMQKVGPLDAASPNATVAAAQPAATVSTGISQQVQAAASESKPAQIGQDDWEIVNSRLEEQAQDKVESNLKYQIKLSGIVLLNAFGVSGQVDNLDVPSLALPHFPGEASGSVAASLRQTVIGLSGTGPEILGARTSGRRADGFLRRIAHRLRLFVVRIDAPAPRPNSIRLGKHVNHRRPRRAFLFAEHSHVVYVDCGAFLCCIGKFVDVDSWNSRGATAQRRPRAIQNRSGDHGSHQLRTCRNHRAVSECE